MKPQPATFVNRYGLGSLSFGVLIAALALCGCKKETSTNNTGAGGGGGGGTPSTAPVASGSGAGLKKVRIGYVGLTCDADLFVAYEKGFFKEEGLDVEMKQYKWDVLQQALSLGQVDATHHLVMFLLKPIEQGVDIKMTGAVHRGCLRVQASVKSGIATAAELKGKKIGIPGFGTPPHIFAMRALVAAGTTP